MGKHRSRAFALPGVVALLVGCMGIFGASTCYGQPRTHVSVSPHQLGEFLPTYPGPSAHASRHPFVSEFRLDSIPTGQGYTRYWFRLLPRNGPVFASDGVAKIVLRDSFDSGLKFQLEVPIQAGSAAIETSELSNVDLDYHSVLVGFYWNNSLLYEVVLNLPNPNASSASNNESLELCSLDTLPTNQNIDVATIRRSNSWTYSYFQNGLLLPIGLVERLPNNWLELTPYENVTIQSVDFLALPPEKISVLQKYVLAGGSLIITRAENSQLTLSHWRNHTSTPEFQVNQDWQEGTNVLAHDGNYVNIPKAPADSSMIGHGFGTLSILKGENDRPSSPNHAFYGSSMEVGSDYWDWLIPDIGRTPIELFLALSLGFVFVVAPGTLLWSKRHGRRVWTLILMPVAASIAIVLLLAIAVLSEGTTSHLRIRSMTHLGTDGQGMAWSRQTGFSQSTKDIVVDKETFTTHLLSPTFNSTDASMIELNPDEVVYRNAMPARNSVQYQLLQPVKVAPLLEVKSSTSQELIVSNSSDFGITGGILKGENGAIFKLDFLPPKETVTLKSCPEAEAYQWLNQLNLKEPLRAPAGAPNSVNYRSYSRRYSSQTGRTYAFDKTWEELMQSPATASMSRIHSIDKRTFIVFLEEAPYLQKILESVPDKHSLHVCVGTW